MKLDGAEVEHVLGSSGDGCEETSLFSSELLGKLLTSFNFSSDDFRVRSWEEMVELSFNSSTGPGRGEHSLDKAPDLASSLASSEVLDGLDMDEA